MHAAINEGWGVGVGWGGILKKGGLSTNAQALSAFNLLVTSFGIVFMRDTVMVMVTCDSEW